MIKLDKEKTVLILGQSKYFNQKKEETRNIIKTRIKAEILKSLDDGYHTFITDSLYGFSLTCIEILATFKSSYDFKLYSYLSSERHHTKWTENNQIDYINSLHHYDEIFILNNFNNTKITDNLYEYLAENCGKLIYYSDNSRLCGNTNDYINLAKEKCYEMINIRLNIPWSSSQLVDIYEDKTNYQKIEIMKNYVRYLFND